MGTIEVKTIKDIQKYMSDIARYWGVRGVVSKDHIDLMKLPYKPRKQKCEIEGFEYEYSYQNCMTDAGDDYAGEIFLPVGNEEYLHIDWSA